MRPPIFGKMDMGQGSESQIAQIGRRRARRAVPTAGPMCDGRYRLTVNQGGPRKAPGPFHKGPVIPLCATPSAEARRSARRAGLAAPRRSQPTGPSKLRNGRRFQSTAIPRAKLSYGRADSAAAPISMCNELERKSGKISSPRDRPESRSRPAAYKIRRPNRAPFFDVPAKVFGKPRLQSTDIKVGGHALHGAAGFPPGRSREPLPVAFTMARLP